MNEEIPERTPEELAAYIDGLTRRIKENAAARERRQAEKK